MTILEHKVMRGPNFWSLSHKQLVVLKIRAPEISAEAAKELIQKAGVLFPALSNKHHIENCTCAGLPQVIKYIALELQNMSGMPCNYATSKACHEKGDFFVIYSYLIERAGLFAGEAAVRITDELLYNREPQIETELEQLKKILKRNSLGPTSNYILNEVKKRNIPYRQFNAGSLMTLGYGDRQKKIRTAVTDTTSGMGIELAGNKEETKRVLEQSNMPVPKGILVYNEEELKERLNEVRFPVVVKPLDGNHGRGVTTNIETLEKALFGFNIAQRISDAVIIEEYIKGDDYRFLVINYKLIAVARRSPAKVIGDGYSTIRELIEKENKNPQRGDTQDHVLALIKIDAVTTKILSDKNLQLESILKKDEELILKDTANISAGGTAEDVTDLVNAETKFMVERIARIFNLNICGIDIMTTAIELPLSAETGGIIEVNAGPGLRMHSNPQEGEARDVASPIIDMLFTSPSDARIPVVAITGTNGKTTTTRLMAHMAKHEGFVPGFSTSDGIYIDGHRVYKGDCTGFISSQDVLFDPGINFAVLECARGGIIRSGLAFDTCDVSIVTNVTPDHLGLKDIHTIEDLARVKMVVPQTTKKDGYAVLNADDDMVYQMTQGLECKIALFSLKEDNERVIQHCKNGGLAATIESGAFTICHGEWKIKLGEVHDIPLTLQGKAESMIKNILAAILGATVSNFKVENIREALRTFVPSPAQTPGRMNLFSFRDFDVVVDYAHNVDGFAEMKKFVENSAAICSTGIISAAGDRRDEDIVKMGSLAAEMFDEIVIRHDTDVRVRTNEEITALLLRGIKEKDDSKNVKVLSNESDALKYSIGKAVKGELIMVCADKVDTTIEMVLSLLEQNLNERPRVEEQH